jgi:RNA polymerase sigma-70 factor, ECF subfamily
MNSAPFTEQRPDPLRSEVQPAGLTSDASRAFESLVRAHYGRLCGFACRLVGSREVAEDVVHEVLLRIWRHREQFEFRDPLAYLYRSVRNRIISDRRRQAGHAKLLARAISGDTIPILNTEQIGIASSLENEDLRRAAAKAVDALPERCRLVFTMRREQGLSYAEIASILDISIKTVENQMTRAGKLLRARLAPYLSLAILTGSMVAEAWRRAAG